ncbi:MAG: MgtC/SapB family protein [bacterium]|nr:MgtC/SapB family protein [bacterium]
MDYPWLNFAVALGLGLFIGIERERSKGEGSTRHQAGIRTFALAVLSGATSFYLGGVTLLSVAVGGTAVLAAISYHRSDKADPGLTTEVALILATLIGGLTISNVTLALALAATVAVVLATKTAAHRFVKNVLTEPEVNDGLIFAVAALVLWPQLPDQYIGPFGALNPHTLGMIVILILAIGACGHIATRILGPRSGLPLAGFVAGFISSTAAIGSLAGRAKRDPTIIASAVAGATLSTVATFIQLALILFTISTATFSAIAPALAAGGLIAAIYGIGFTLRALKTVNPKESVSGSAFSIKTALILVATMAVMLVLAAGLEKMFGQKGIVIGAAVAGIADTHGPSISVASLVASGKLVPEASIVPILTAMTCNAVSKSVMALSAGSIDFSLRIIPGLVLSMIAAWAIAMTGYVF